GGGTGRGGGVRGGAVGVRGGAGGGWVHLPAGEIRPGGLRGPAATQRSSNSTTQFIRSGYFNSGSSNRKFGHCARGGKLSRAKVSRCAVMAVAPRQDRSWPTSPRMAAPIEIRYIDRAANSAHSRESGNPGPKAGSPLSRGRTDEHWDATHILLRRERRFSRAVLQQLAGDHHLLHLGRAFVDA